MADETGCIEVVLWRDLNWEIKAGDIIRIPFAVTKLYQNRLSINLAPQIGRLEKIGEFTKRFVDKPNMVQFA